MYTRQEASQMRKKFWTSFGQYMRPLPGADGDTINWLNYKTGIRHLYFRMDANTEKASIAIELRHPDLSMQQHYFDQLQQLKNILEQETAEEWKWQLHQPDEDGNTVSKISTTLTKVNVFTNGDWPTIISFFKPRLLALDRFWYAVKDGFE
jgi:Domain of unknown function (DUF4268)